MNEAETITRKKLKTMEETTQKQKAPDLSNTVLAAVFESGIDKQNNFYAEFKALLGKYDAEIEIEDFGRDWISDEKMVVTFNWDEKLANRTGDGGVPQLIIGACINGS